MEATPRDPTWYRDAVIYQVHVRSFGDSDGDGVGDFPGLTARLDHLAGLGVTAIWLLPFYPSPLRDDGYDIADYGGINPAYGSLRDFRTFLGKAHALGLRVITELVLNHTSDAHPWFQRARRAAPGSRWRDFYVWSDTPDRYPEVRVIFEDYESSNWAWDPVAGAYYFHRFFSHQPDLNYDNPEVRATMLRVIDRWLAMGVDGVRLDAVPYLFERDGTNGENLPETHGFLRELRAHVDANFPDRMLLAEANQWPEDAVAYFGNGDECHMAFHFPLMPRLYMALRMEDRHPVIDILSQTPSIPDGAQWAIFLRNHDELTLEMVTDEERDYMYRAYASEPRMRVNLGIRRRLAPLMGNDRRKIELLNGLLFALPGTPVMYYGDEIGMGDNVYLGDRDSVRTPMQWSPDRNAGFSTANPQRLFLPVVIDPDFHYESVNVEAQAANPSSLMNWLRRLIAVRRQHAVLGRGEISFLQPVNARVLAFLRSDEDETVLVVANLSRHAQSVHLDLHDHRGAVLVELFGGMTFPQVGEGAYHLTLGPYAFYWFALEPQPAALPPEGVGADLPVGAVDGDWHDLFTSRGQPELHRLLPALIRRARWFAGRHRDVASVVLDDVVALGPGRRPVAWMCLVDVEYLSGEPDTYVVPIVAVQGPDAMNLVTDRPEAALAWVDVAGGERVLLADGLADPAVVELLPGLFTARRPVRWASGGSMSGEASSSLRGMVASGDLPAGERLAGEHANSLRIFGDALVVKLFRRAQPGTNPDLEVGRHLAAVGFRNAPRVLGALEYKRPGTNGDGGGPRTIAIATAQVPNEGDAWHYMVDRLGLFVEAVASTPVAAGFDDPGDESFVSGGTPVDGELGEHLVPFLDGAARLGARLGELHLALTGGGDPAFTADPFTTLWQRSLYQSMRSRLGPVWDALSAVVEDLDPDVAVVARRVLASGARAEEIFGVLLGERFAASRIRVHGDLHLGQVLLSGRDWVFIDFEGDPSRPLSARRLRRPGVVDLAGLLRSLDHALHHAVDTALRTAVLRPDQVDDALAAGGVWRWRIGSEMTASYRAAVAGSGLVPDDSGSFARLWRPIVLDGLVSELSHQLVRNRSRSVVALRAIDRLLGGPDHHRRAEER